MTRGTRPVGAFCIEQLHERVLFSTGVLQLSSALVLTGSNTAAGSVTVNNGSLAVAYGARPIAGDTNADGKVDTLDFAALAANYGHKGNWSQGDFNADGRINHTDFNLIADSLGQTGFRYPYVSTGDASLDGKVDTLDFNSLAANFGGTGKIWSQADFNYGGVG